MPAMPAVWPRPTPDSRSTLVLRTRIYETDLMGIVHHAAYLHYFETARVEYLRRRGSEYTTWTQRGVHLAVAESHVRHKRPLRFDDRIVIETTLTELGRASAQFTYRLVRESALDETVAEGTTLLACVGNDGMIGLIPEDLAQSICGPETHPRPPDPA
jgi:acyl-CoA thioester hydrolase